MNKHKNNSLEYIESYSDDKNSPEFEENLQQLIEDYDQDSNRLNIIIKQSDKQQKQLVLLNEELNIYKNNLEEKIEEEIKKRKEKEAMLLQQSKLAAMGEMIDSVAHQWKQPISIISFRTAMLTIDHEDNLIDKKYITEFQNMQNTQITHMTNTLDEFRSFFRPDKKTEKFNVTTMIEKVLLLIKDEFIQFNINISINTINDIHLEGIENEFQHLIINVLNNAKDAFNDNSIKNRQITINILNIDKINKIEIIDNAGGIPEDVIIDIFLSLIHI